MPTSRPFAYNTGAGITGTSQYGSIAVGTPTDGFSSTGLQWWMGPDEDSRYVIAHTDLGGRPTAIGVTGYLGFWGSVTKTEASFIELANIIGGQTFANGATAANWLNNNGYWTSYSTIVTSGLTLRLDASDSSSYSGSGTTWYDIAGTQENITLVNSPSFTSASPSYFTFNGTTQRGTGTGNVIPTNTYTKSVWFYLNGYSDNNLVSSSTGGHFIFMGASTNKIYCGHANWPAYDAFPSTSTISLSTWYNVTLTFNTTDGMVLYINGVQDATYTANKSARGGDGSTNIATFGGGNLLNGRISKVYCYNRSLTSSEVLQNFNADKSQFGL